MVSVCSYSEIHKERIRNFDSEHCWFSFSFVFVFVFIEHSVDPYMDIEFVVEGNNEYMYMSANYIHYIVKQKIFTTVLKN